MTRSTKIAWIFVLLFVLIMIWLKQKSLYDNEDLFHHWLASNQLTEIELKLKTAGLHSTDELLNLKSIQDLNLEEAQSSRLNLAIGKLKLHQWLLGNQLEQLEPELAKNGISTLEHLQFLSPEEEKQMLEKMNWNGKRDKFFTALYSLKEKVTGTKTSTDNGSVSSTSVVSKIFYMLFIVLSIGICLIGLYYCLVNILEAITVTIIQLIMYMFITTTWVIIGTIAGAILSALTGRRATFPEPPSFASLRASSANSRNSSFSFLRQSNSSQNRRERSSSSFHLGLYDRITGRNLDVTKCQIEWNSKDWVEVGKSTVATIHLRCKNGSNYKLQASDNIHIKISQVAAPRTVLPHAVEPAKMIGEEIIKVSFTARLAGGYAIDIRINGLIPTPNSRTITRHYKAGPVDPSKTVFLLQSNTIVVTSGLYHSMQVIPKDRFGNSANICQDVLTAEIRRGCSSGQLINPECVVDRTVGGDSNQYEILLKVEEAGYYVGCVKYKGSTIGPSSIHIISLNETDASTVDKNVAKKCNVYYEAYVQSSGSKPKRVYCYPSPKQIQVKEYIIFGIIPKRIYTCKVCPSTRIIFHEVPDTFTLDDGYQSPLVLSSPHREVFAATFYKFLLKNIGGSEKFQDKQKFFYTEVKKLKNYRMRGEHNMTVSRYNLLEDAISATKHLSGSDWYKKFCIEFEGEEGLDWGGVSREFFEMICVRCFDPSYELFMRFADNPQALVHPNPKRSSHLKLKYYEFAGRVVGKCLYESAVGNTLMVKARFSRSFLAQIIGLRINYKYFESDNPELYTTKIQYIKDNDVDDLGLVFAEEEFNSNGGQPITVPLIDKGDEIDVTNQNKLQYLNLLAQYKLSKCVKDEVDHFLKGLNDIIPDHLLSIFDENELELLMCGMGTVNYNDLKLHAVVNGSNEEFQRVVSWFWTLVSGFTQEEMAKLLQFVTGCSQLPPGGFKDLSPAFQIVSSPTHGRLPTAHTCFNQLCLPQYDSYEQFQQSLTMALNEGSEGFGFA